MFGIRSAPSRGIASFAALFALLLIGVAQAETADDVTKKISELTDAINKYDEKAPVSPKALTELRTLLLSKKLIGPNAAPAFIQISTEIQTILKDEKSRNQIAANPGGPASSKDLFDALVKQSEDDVVKQRFADLLQKLATLISPKPPILSTQVVLRQALLEPPANRVPQARAAFDTAWAAITEDYKIHILRSWYGDLRTRWREGRLCAATSTVMTKCEAQEACRLDGQNAITYDPAILCGYDPAPLVDPDFKGVAIEFVCVRGGKEIWDAIARQPGINPATRAPWDDDEINRVTLRSSGMSFRCPFPAPTPPG